MKLCLCCGAECGSSAIACPRCGEGSWSALCGIVEAELVPALTELSEALSPQPAPAPKPRRSRR